MRMRCVAQEHSNEPLTNDLGEDKSKHLEVIKCGAVLSKCTTLIMTRAETLGEDLSGALTALTQHGVEGAPLIFFFKKR